MIEQDKFKDIKTGDKVLVIDKVSTGWNTWESFYVPKEVGKVTPKQFYVGENRYKKDDGMKVGGGWDDKVYFKGDEIKGCGDKVTIVNNQLEERNDFVMRKNKIYILTKSLEKIKLSIDTPNIVEIDKKINEIIELIENKEEK